MTNQEIAALGPALAGYLKGYRDCFLQARTATHFDNYCRGLLSDPPRKSVEPIALACGTAARTLQEFLVTADGQHETARNKFQRRVADVLDELPDDARGVRFDWLVFDEGYGSKVPLLRALSLVGQKFVGEVPVSFAVATDEGAPAQRADAVLTATDARRGRRFRLGRATTNARAWRACGHSAWAGGRALTPVAAVGEATGEVKYFVRARRIFQLPTSSVFGPGLRSS